MAKDRAKDSSIPPNTFPSTPPPAAGGADLSTWLLNATSRMEGLLGRLEATLTATNGQLDRIESKLTEVEKEVAGHGKWMHTLKVFSAVVMALLIWIFVNAAWPLVKKGLGIP